MGRGAKLWNAGFRQMVNVETQPWDMGLRGGGNYARNPGYRRLE
jgi:hypothetical protein